GYAGGSAGANDGYGLGKGSGGYTASTISGGGGAGYGGNGGDGYSSDGAAGSAYGSATKLSQLGSGGGGAHSYYSYDPCNAYAPGGSGGGAILLNISDTLVVNGSIFADGGVGGTVSSSLCHAYGGGGSGGSVYIITDTFVGDGNITTNGGNGNNSKGGGGGGGRIALYYTTKTFTGTTNATGGIGNQVGGAGTIYTKETGTNGELLIDNSGNAGVYTPINETISFDNLTVQNSAKLNITTGIILTSSIVTLSSGTLLVDSNAILNATNLTLTSSATLTLSSNAILNTTIFSLQSSSTITNSGNITISSFADLQSGTFTTVNGIVSKIPTVNVSSGIVNYDGVMESDVVNVISGGTLSHTANSASHVYSLNITSANLTIESGGMINVSGKGYAGGSAG
ncbi:MAG: hypothetical protein KAU20_03150, partial [Nanoarchaeota archaeon]|nr:hypothetical protein [Nanoarchaeota archaeon]